MSYFATCAGLQIVSGSLMIPLVGAWTADVHLATDQAISGSVQVVIGNLTLQGFVYRTAPYGGQTRARLVGGYGGWRKTIGDQGYGSSSGVQLSHVLQDAAAACGEKVSIAADRSVGSAYTRAEAPASDVLWQMLAQGMIASWYIDVAGVTQTKAWPSATIQTPFTVTDQRPEEGLVVIATEDYASWMPGTSFTSPLLSGTYTNGGVTYVWTDDGQFRFEVLTGTTDRLVGAFNALVDRRTASLRFHGRYAYTISGPSATSVDATPNDKTLGLPELQNVPIRADSISSYVPPNGGECHIMFLDGVPTKPICVWTAEQPTMAQLLSGATPIALVGCQVQSFLPPTLPVVGDVGGSPFTGTITVLNPISGVITTGSPQVSSA